MAALGSKNLAGLAVLAYSVEDVQFRLKLTRHAEPTEGEQPTNPGWDSVWRAHDRQEGSG